MPLATWKVLLKRLDQLEYQYVSTLYRASEPVPGEEMLLRIGAQQVYGRIVEVKKDLCTKAGATVFTVNAEETRLTSD